MAAPYFLIALALASAVSAQTYFFGGASSVAIFASDAVKEYNKRNNPDLPPYDSVGSGSGISGLFSGKYKCGASDDPLDNVQNAQADSVGGKLTLPFTLTHYNMMTKKAAGIQLTTNQMARIYRKSGAIVNWSQLKKGLTGKVIPVARLDRSGTTKVFTDYLAKSEEWVAPSGTSFCTLNPDFFRANIVCRAGTEGVRKFLATNSNGIGYIQTGAGLIVNLRPTAIKNPAGSFINPTRADPAQSIPRTLPPSDGNWAGVDLLAKSGKNTYPWVSFVYVFTLKRGGASAKKFLNFLQSSIVQNLVNTRYEKSLFRLPPSITKKNTAAIKTL